MAAAGIDEVYIRQSQDWVADIFQKIVKRTGFGKSYAVVIGIGRYNNYLSLDAPDQDATEFRDFLKNEAEFDYVITLTNAKATKTRIEGVMEVTLPNLVKPGDRVLFYFSGHGATRHLSNGNKRGYLVLGDSGANAWDSMIDMPRLMEWAQNIESAQHVLFVIDACFSGLAAYQVKAVDVATKTIERLSQPAHHIVTAGVEDEESYAFNGKSIFTSEFLAAARGELATTSGGIVSLSEIVTSVGHAIDRKRAELGDQIKMSPHMYQTRPERDGGEFFFLTKTKASPQGDTAVVTSRVEHKTGDPLPNLSAPAGTIHGLSVPVANQPTSLQPDEEAWNSISSSHLPKDIESFISNFPTSPLRPRAEDRLKELRTANLPPVPGSLADRPTLPSYSPSPASERPTLPSYSPSPASERPTLPSYSPSPASERSTLPSYPPSPVPTRHPAFAARTKPPPHTSARDHPRASSCFTFNGERYCN